MQFLLSGSALLEMSLVRETLVKAWARDKPAAQLRLSLIGVGMARATVYDLPPESRNAWSRSLEHRLNELQQDSGRPIPLDERVFAEWFAIRTVTPLQHSVIDKDGQSILEDIGQDQRLEIATALAYAMKLVDPWKPFHDQLRAMGLGDHIESIR
jgi:hypothetical protein